MRCALELPRTCSISTTRTTPSSRPIPCQPTRRRWPSSPSRSARGPPCSAETRGIRKLTEQSDATDLSGRVAVVTGAAAGLGRAEAIGLARSGATVVVNDMAAALDKSDVFDEIAAAGSEAVAVGGGIRVGATADELVATAESLGGLDIVVNNAGITRDKMLLTCLTRTGTPSSPCICAGTFC